ncbi:alpha-2-macroglobulin receptor-associated protein isoform X2 [Galleria mellonella]|uniref:Alpha-2-macroglobulin receptor-associated protein isoform X2 n=1 Tax=Galleria mellonella TaxID=7137 RepID=A0A6J1X238_GALME|nr:alpha-2-macroglobulin receptor-associated protein isoform X2 [Galleria mellonella]
MLTPSKTLLKLVIVSITINSVICENKYTRSANEKKTEVDFRTLDKPFRMNKLNLLWTKAQHRLTEPKLKSLYSDLMIQDKEEITYKRVKSDGGDKEGLKEADLRRKLTNIMNNYGLREHFEDNAPRQKQYPAYNSAIDDHINRSLFKDKKLNQLWAKAEASGFTREELAALKEEFTHHQEKIDQYYDLLNDVEAGEKNQYKNAINEDELEQYNEIDDHRLKTNEIKNDYLDKANLVREKHRGLRDGMDRLQRITARGPNNKEFIEPKVQGLWRMAAAANFTVDELASLKVELQHYESRLLKLRTLHADHVAAAGDKLDHFDDQQQMIKKHSRKVEKMHADLEGRILQRHSEL